MVYKDAKILKLSAWDPYPELLLKELCNYIFKDNE
jgi:hypothetical protein